MQKILSIVLSLFLTFTSACAQIPVERPAIKNPAFDKKISQLIDFSVPTIGVKTLKGMDDEVIICDARKKEEYAISHIPNARYVGYKGFDISRLSDVSKDQTIILYCSIGYRSEKIGKKLKKAGYTNVYNLYGSIFEWANEGYPLVNEAGKSTNQVHTYNKKWSKWVDSDTIEKVW